MMRLLFILLLVSAALNARADDESHWQILQKAAVAAHALSYQGIFVCQSGGQAKSVQLKHLFDGQHEFARSVVLDGAPREMLNQNGNLVIYNQKNEKVIIEKRRGHHMFPAVLPIEISTIKQNYSLRTGQTERVAGRAVKTLLLEPKDQFRNRHQIWIDDEYGLILKFLTFNQRNDAIDNVAFSQINLFNTVDLDWFKPQIETNKHYVMEENSPTIDHNPSPHWQLKELPAGFSKIDQMVRKIPGKPIPVTHIVFSDGLASISLFIEQFSAGAKAKVRTGANMVGHTSVYVRTAGFLQITAVGEVPPVTTAHIANAVIFVE